MKLYRIDDSLIPESSITAFNLNEVSGGNFEIGIHVLGGGQYFLPPMPLETCEIFLKTTFSAEIRNVHQSED